MASTLFDNIITFSRGSNATVTGPTGLIQWAPNNLITFSEQFDNAAWIRVAASVTANVALAPNNTVTADKLVEDATTGVHSIYQIYSQVAGTTYTVSFYAKAAERTWVRTRAAAGVNYFDLANGTIGTLAAGVTATITPVGDGWYRVTATYTASTTGSSNTQIAPTTADNVDSYTGTVGSGVIIWGAQLELGSTATTYNPTSVKNLLGFSEAFDNAAWGKTRASIVTGAQANPVNGLFTAQKLMEDTSTGTHLTQQTAGIVGNPQVTSVYAKAAGRSWIRIQMGSIASAYFDVATGTIGILTNCTATITDVGSGWYRCAVYATRTANGNNIVYLASADNIISYTGDGNSGVYIYGAQLSDSASLDPYVPTPGAAPSSTAYYGPRFDYDPVTLLPRGLLVEEQRTNLLVRSEEFDNASWDKTASVTANQLVSPDGRTTGDLVSTVSNFQYVRQLITATANAQYTATFFVKPVTGSTTIRILLTNAPQTEYAGSNFGLTGDGSLGTIFTTGTGVLVSRSITKLADGWYRCSVTATNNTTSLYSLIDNHSGGIMSFGVYGAQLEAGSFATSYIPTIASQVTRSADVATITGQNFGQWYNQAQGGFVMEVTSANGLRSGGGVQGLFSLNDGTTTNVMNAGRLATRLVRFNGTGSPAGDVTSVATMADSTTAKIASAYATNDWGLSLNGAAAVTDTSAVVPPVTRLGIASLDGLFDPSAQWGGHIRNITYYPVRPSNTQTQGLSA